MSDENNTREVVFTAKAPKPPSFLSQAMTLGDVVFCSGQVAVDPETGELVEGTVADRTKQIMSNLGAVLEAAGSGFDDIVKCNIYLVNQDDFAVMNGAYEACFQGVKPARTCVFVKALPLGTDVEIECVAKAKGSSKGRL